MVPSIFMQIPSKHVSHMSFFYCIIYYMTITFFGKFIR